MRRARLTKPSESGGAQRVTAAGVRRMASIAFCGILPIAVVVALFAATIEDGTMATDLRQVHRAADAIVQGEDPYPPVGDPLTASSRAYVYPPLPALLATPLTLLSIEAAGLLLMGLLVAVALAIPFVLGVRDWRCYGIVLLWPPVISAIQTGNVTLWFALACALAWRLRDRLVAPSAAIGVTLALKFVLWPLVVWLTATRRLGAAALTCVVGIGLLVLSWAAIGFTGLTGYPDLLRRLQDSVGDDAYTAYVLALDLGASTAVARTIWLAIGAGLLAAVVRAGRRGDDRRAFVLTIAATLALSPLVWLHYFALLLVVVAVTQRTLSPVWFVPLVMLVSPGSGNPTLFETIAALGAATATIALALRTSDNAERVADNDRVPRMEPHHSGSDPATLAGRPA